MFKEVQIDFGDIIEWSGLCKNERDEQKNRYYSLKWFGDNSVKFNINNNFEVSFSPFLNADYIIDNRFIFEQGILTAFKYTEAVEWETVLDDILFIAQFIGLGIRNKVEVKLLKYIQATTCKLNQQIQGNELSIDAKGIVSLGVETSNETVRVEKVNLSFSLTDDNIACIFYKWNKEYPLLRPVVNLYFSTIFNIAGTPEMLFINLTQALETFHARFIAKDLNVYKERVDKIIASSSLSNAEGEKWRNFLLDKNQMKSKFIFFKNRLADLVFAEGQQFHPKKFDVLDYICKIKDTRNYYTHYDLSERGKHFTTDELYHINHHLIILLEYYIYELLGINRNNIREMTINRIEQIDFIIDRI